MNKKKLVILSICIILVSVFFANIVILHDDHFTEECHDIYCTQCIVATLLTEILKNISLYEFKMIILIAILYQFIKLKLKNINENSTLIHLKVRLNE